MTAGLYLIAVPARDETRNRTGRCLLPLNHHGDHWTPT